MLLHRPTVVKLAGGDTPEVGGPAAVVATAACWSVARCEQLLDMRWSYPRPAEGLPNPGPEPCLKLAVSQVSHWWPSSMRSACWVAADVYVAVVSEGGPERPLGGLLGPCNPDERLAEVPLSRADVGAAVGMALGTTWMVPFHGPALGCVRCCAAGKEREVAVVGRERGMA